MIVRTRLGLNTSSITRKFFRIFLGALWGACKWRQGVNLIANHPSGIRACVQCKYDSNHVGNSAIQEVVACKAHYSSAHTVAALHSGFTKSAIYLAMPNNAILIGTGEPQEPPCLDNSILFFYHIAFRINDFFAIRWRVNSSVAIRRTFSLHSQQEQLVDDLADFGQQPDPSCSVSGTHSHQAGLPHV